MNGSKGLEHDHGDSSVTTNVVEGEGRKEILKGLQSLKHSAVSKAKRASRLLKEHNISPINSGSSLAEEQQRKENISQPVLIFSSDTSDVQSHEAEEEVSNKVMEEEVTTISQSSRSLSSRTKKSKEGITKAKKFVNRMLLSGSHTLPSSSSSPSPSSSPTSSSPWGSAMELEHYEKESLDATGERLPHQPLYLSPNRSESTPTLSKSSHHYASEAHDHEDERTKRETKVKSFAKKILSGSGITKSKIPLATSSSSASQGNERQQSTSLSAAVPNVNSVDLKKSASHHHTVKQQEPFPGIPLKQAVCNIDSIPNVEIPGLNSSGENELDFNNSPSQLGDHTEGGGLLELRILEARDLYAADEGLVDAYCEIKLIGYFGNATKKEVKKTKVAKATLNPRWDETFSFDFDIGVCSGVKIVCKDNHRFREVS